MMYPWQKKLRYLKYEYTNLFKEKYKKVCIFMHGSGGFAKTSLYFMHVMANSGYLVIAPDHIEDHEGTLGKIKYNSSEKTVCTKRNQKKYRYVVEYRLNELNTCIRFVNACFPNAKVVTLGTSEGAIAVAKSRVQVHTKIICAYVLRGSYFEPRDIFHKPKGTKVINIHGDKDQYFGDNDSISSQTHSQCGGKHWTDGHKIGVKRIILKNTDHNILKRQRNLAMIKGMIS